MFGLVGELNESIEKGPDTPLGRLKETEVTAPADKTGTTTRRDARRARGGKVKGRISATGSLCELVYKGRRRGARDSAPSTEAPVATTRSPDDADLSCLSFCSSSFCSTLGP